MTWEKIDRVWCLNCNFKSVYTHGTPSHEKHLTYVEAGIAFTLADAERLAELFETLDVVTGQATLDTPSGCRLTLLREA